MTRTTRVRTKQWMIKFVDMNKKLKSKDGEESPVKKSVRETVRDMLMKAWKNAADLAEKNKVSEGELPPALQKHIDKKKKDKEAKEEEVMPTKEADKGSKGDKPYPHLKASYGMKKASYMMK